MHLYNLVYLDVRVEKPNNGPLISSSVWVGRDGCWWDSIDPDVCERPDPDFEDESVVITVIPDHDDPVWWHLQADLLHTVHRRFGTSVVGDHIGEPDLIASSDIFSNVDGGDTSSHRLSFGTLVLKI